MILKVSFLLYLSSFMQHEASFRWNLLSRCFQSAFEHYGYSTALRRKLCGGKYTNKKSTLNLEVIRSINQVCKF